MVFPLGLLHLVPSLFLVELNTFLASPVSQVLHCTFGSLFTDRCIATYLGYHCRGFDPAIVFLAWLSGTLTQASKTSHSCILCACKTSTYLPNPVRPQLQGLLSVCLAENIYFLCDCILSSGILFSNEFSFLQVGAFDEWCLPLKASFLLSLWKVCSFSLMVPSQQIQRICSYSFNGFKQVRVLFLIQLLIFHILSTF